MKRRLIDFGLRGRYASRMELPRRGHKNRGYFPAADGRLVANSSGMGIPFEIGCVTDSCWVGLGASLIFGCMVFHQLVECLGQLACHGTWGAGADGASIDLCDGDDFRGGACQEHLLCGVQVVLG